MIPPTQAQRPDITAQPALDIPDDASVDLSGVLQESQIMEVLQKRWINAEEAYSNCVDKAKFRPFLKAQPDEWAG